MQEARVNVTTKQKCLSLARSLGKSSAVARSLSPYEAADLPQVLLRYLLLSTWYSQVGHVVVLRLDCMPYDNASAQQCHIVWLVGSAPSCCSPDQSVLMWTTDFHAAVQYLCRLA